MLFVVGKIKNALFSVLRSANGPKKLSCIHIFINHNFQVMYGRMDNK